MDTNIRQASLHPTEKQNSEAICALLTLKVLVATTDAQWEGMGGVR